MDKKIEICVGKKKNFQYVLFAAGVILAAVIAGIGIYNTPAKRLERMLDLGNKYLEAYDYEQAVIQFNKAIEIDPMSVEAYLGLVEVYIRTGDFDMALEYAKKGYELTGDERLREKIEMIESGNITASNGNLMEVGYYDADDNLIGYEKYTYNLLGQKEMTSVYDGNGVEVDSGLFQYDQNNNRTISYYYYPSIQRLERMEYEYDQDGNVIKIEKFENKSGKFVECIEYEYDSGGRTIRQNFYDEYNNLKNYDEMENNSEGKCTKVSRFDGMDNLMGYEEYEYDLSGYPIKEKSYDNLGNLQQYFEYGFDSDGKRIWGKSFDASGNLIDYWK